MLYKLAVALLPYLALHERFEHMYWFFINEVLSRLIIYALVSLIIGWLFGPRALSIVRDFWIGVLRFLSDLVLSVAKFFLGLLVRFVLRGPSAGGRK